MRAAGTALGLGVVALLVVALLGTLDDTSTPRTSEMSETSERDASVRGDAAGQQVTAADRSRAALPPCPSPDAGGPAALRGVELVCASDGARTDLAATVAGRPTLLNLWAYWCAPCREELPAMAEYARRGTGVQVLTVHADPDAAAGLEELARLGVRLPTVQDDDRGVAAALGLPAVLPLSVVLRADGSTAAVLPRAFTGADEIAAAVDSALNDSALDTRP